MTTEANSSPSMFISALELFKIGIGPSSSHTMGPMLAAHQFLQSVRRHAGTEGLAPGSRLRCILKGSLAATGRGHATDRAVALGLHGYLPADIASHDLHSLVATVWEREAIEIDPGRWLAFRASADIVFDTGPPLPAHPNGMIFELLDRDGRTRLTETWFSIGGGFVSTEAEIGAVVAPLKMASVPDVPHGFDSARSMLAMARQSGLSIAGMKRRNELSLHSATALDDGLTRIWLAMKRCVERGLDAEGELPGGLGIPRRAKRLHQHLLAAPERVDANDWLCAYAMAVNEENAAGHMVVTAPTNGAAGVVPAVLYHFMNSEQGSTDDAHTFLLTAAAIGGLIKHRSSISGAEVGCQGEVGSAAAMAAAGLCAVRGGTPEQVEHAAEMALEHHLGMTCDPVAGLVQVPCIERNGFGAIKAYTAASLALHGGGEHFVSLDECIAAMKQTGEEMSVKFKETSLGGLAVTITEC